MGELYEHSYIEQLRNAVVLSLPQWGLPCSSHVTLLTVSENATFQVTDEQGRRLCVVRVHRPRYHTLAEIESELLWIDTLREQQVVTTPRPLPLLSGGWIASFQDGLETRYLVLLTSCLAWNPLPGNRSLQASVNWGRSQPGCIIMPGTGSSPQSFTRKTWNFDTTIGDTPHWGHWQDCPGLTTADQDLLSETVALIKTRLDSYGASAMRFGLIHADLRLANLLVDGDTLAVIDFDDCGIGWYVYDFAAAISFMEEDPQVPELLKAWVSGYRDVAELDQDDEALIPIFIMLRRLMLTAWLATHSETPTARDLGVGFLDGTLRMARYMLQTGTPLDLQ